MIVGEDYGFLSGIGAMCRHSMLACVVQFVLQTEIKGQANPPVNRSRLPVQSLRLRRPPTSRMTEFPT
jgi:hypothetical protein